MNEAYGGDRGHYFAGKLMTARDFAMEQDYLVGRRRLLSRLLHGMGVVSGLNVLRLDEQTFTLEAGVALDALGREIVVEEPRARRLPGVEGYGACGDTAYLCLRYAEELREETFSAASADQGGLTRDYNCVHEGYGLYLTPDPPDPGGLGALWEQTLTLYDGNGLRLSLTLPRFARPGGPVPGKVRFEKRGRAAPGHYRLVLTGDCFSTLELSYDETEAGSDREDEREFSLACTAAAETLAELRAEEIAVRCGGVEETPPPCGMELTVTARAPARAVAEAYFSRAWGGAEEDAPVCLARFRLAADAPGCFIQSVEPNPFGQYVASTALLQLLQTLPGAGAPVSENGAPPAAEETVPALPGEARTAAGVEIVRLGYAAKPGRDYFSDEIVHGLGYGSVAVVAALENEPPPLSGEEALLFFGEPGIFRGERFPHTLPKVRLGAVAAPGRGTLRLGVRLLEKTNRQTLSVRWWAFRRGEEEAGERAGTAVAVTVAPNTAALEPLGQTRFSATVEGEADQSVHWSVAEPEGGSVDENGVYLAPAREGVFEVRAQSARHEEAHGSAYVVVHGAEE